MLFLLLLLLLLHSCLRQNTHQNQISSPLGHVLPIRTFPNADVHTHARTHARTHSAFALRHIISPISVNYNWIGGHLSTLKATWGWWQSVLSVEQQPLSGALETLPCAWKLCLVRGHIALCVEALPCAWKHCPVHVNRALCMETWHCAWKLALCVEDLPCAWKLCLVRGKRALCMESEPCAWKPCLVRGSFALCVEIWPCGNTGLGLHCPSWSWLSFCRARFTLSYVATRV